MGKVPNRAKSSSKEATVVYFAYFSKNQVFLGYQG